MPGEWVHPPITVDFLDGYGAGEHFRWRVVPSNNYLALVKSARREKRNERVTLYKPTNLGFGRRPPSARLSSLATVGHNNPMQTGGLNEGRLA